MARVRYDLDEVRAAVAAVATGVKDRATVGLAVRGSLAVLESRAPGHHVEVRVPPYGAVQCVAGPRHTRGTPPAVVELAAAAWLDLAAGRRTWAEVVESGQVAASGERADLAPYLPLL